MSAAFPPLVPQHFLGGIARVFDCRFSTAAHHSVISSDRDTLQPELVLLSTGEQALITSIHAVVRGCAIVSVMLQDYMSILVEVFANSDRS